MKVVVLNGSPKGNLSITMQYVHYIQKQFPQHELAIRNIAERIKKLESDEASFNEIIEEVRNADGVLWAFPLYHALVASQYKRFIELIWERGKVDAFTGKYAATLTTSIHFYDHTAHNYINAISDDLGMRYVGGLSAAMQDLLEEEGQKQVRYFAEDFFEAIEKRRPTVRNYPALRFDPIDYVPEPVERKVDEGGKKVLVLTDVEDPDSNLAKMVERFRATFVGDIEIINLHDIAIKGGCLGCLRCGYDNQCAYADKDDYMAFFNSKVKPSDILVWAGTIKDRYLSSRWKLFFDRSFFNTHQPTLTGKQVAMIVSGPLGQIPNLRQILELYPDFGQGNLVDIVTDEYDTSSEMDGMLQTLAERLVHSAQVGYIKPRTFLSVAAMKIFRDEIYGGLRFPFVADHQYYKQHGLYDFPQRHWGRRLLSSAMMLLARIPRMREEIYVKQMKEHMVQPYQKVLAR